MAVVARELEALGGLAVWVSGGARFFVFRLTGG